MYVIEDSFVWINPQFYQWEAGISPVYNQHQGSNVGSGFFEVLKGRYEQESEQEHQKSIIFDLSYDEL